MSKKVKGILWGVAVNDVGYAVTRRENGEEVWKCPFYKVWHKMLERCYSSKWREKHPTYEDVTIREDWLKFSTFKAWMEMQDWEGKVLDKDLKVIGNKVYGPDTCLFISKDLNSFLTMKKSNQGEYPIGVSYRFEERATYSKPFVASVSKKGRGNKTLGYRKTPEEAHMLWLAGKIEGFNDYLCDDTEINAAIQRWQTMLQNHLNNNTVYEH